MTSELLKHEISLTEDFDDILACAIFFVVAAFVVFLYYVACSPGNAAHYKAAIARAPIGVSDEAMTGAWRVIIARVPDRYMTYYYNENDDAHHKLALKAKAERWVASHER